MTLSKLRILLALFLMTVCGVSLTAVSVARITPVSVLNIPNPVSYYEVESDSTFCLYYLDTDNQARMVLSRLRINSLSGEVDNDILYLQYTQWYVWSINARREYGKLWFYFIMYNNSERNVCALSVDASETCQFFSHPASSYLDAPIIQFPEGNIIYRDGVDAYKWNLQTGVAEFLLEHQEGTGGYNIRSLFKCGDEYVLIYGIGFEVIPFVVNANLVIHQYPSLEREMEITYTFEPGAYFAEWDELWTMGCGVIEITDDTLSFTLLHEDPIDDPGMPFYFSYWDFKTKFTVYTMERHACTYLNGFGDDSTLLFRVYNYLGNGNLGLYGGFPHIVDFPGIPCAVHPFRENMLLTAYGTSNHNLTFHLANLSTNSWMTVDPLYITYPYVGAGYSTMCLSDNFIYILRGNLLIYQIDITTENDDMLQPPPQPLSAYPNPFSGKVSFKYEKELENQEVEIFNIKGQLVKSVRLSENSAHWDGRDFNNNVCPKGVYLVKTEGENPLTLRVTLIQ